MLRVGLTGSIGMGKSTTAQMFKEHGFHIWDADAAVHRLYAKGGAAVKPLEIAFGNVVKNGGVDRALLKEQITDNPTALKTLEDIVHPLVAQDRQDFIVAHPNHDLIFDMPLLFEIGADEWLDVVVVVSCPADIQRDRVLSRPGTTVVQFEFILSQQMPDTEKRARADYVIDTQTLDGTRKAVAETVNQLREHHG
jgi:dephospho-CoA kinase